MPRPQCTQVYNLFYPSDPSAVRMEPLMNERFKFVHPSKVARYQKFPLGDGQSIHVGELPYFLDLFYLFIEASLSQKRATPEGDLI